MPETYGTATLSCSVATLTLSCWQDGGSEKWPPEVGVALRHPDGGCVGVCSTLGCSDKLDKAKPHPLPVKLPGVFHSGRQPGPDPVVELWQCELAASEVADLAWTGEKNKDQMMMGIKKIMDWMAIKAVGPDDATSTIGRISEERYRALDRDEVSINAQSRALANARKKERHVNKIIGLYCQTAPKVSLTSTPTLTLTQSQSGDDG